MAAQCIAVHKRRQMRLIRFSTATSVATTGILVDGRVHALAGLVPDAPRDTLDAIAYWDRIKTAIDGAATCEGGLPLEQVTLRAPIARPGKILGIGLNYADHIEEAKDAGLKIPTDQVWFCKQPTSVNVLSAMSSCRRSQTCSTTRSSW